MHVWTPRRVGVLVAGFVVFLVGYLLYTRWLGGIDGLPPLPAAYFPRQGGVLPLLHADAPISTVDEMLQMAFGAGAPELKYPIRVGSKRGVFLAARNFGFEPDGRIRLDPVSLALIGKAAPGKFPEINRLRADKVFLTLDRPITNPNDLGNRRIIAGDLRGEIKIVHNRRTPQQDDDIAIDIPTGPVFFDDAKRLIATDADIKLLDMHSKPEPMTVTATGLEVHLSPSPSPSPGQKPPPRPRNDRDSGVEMIVLRSNVNMHLYLDSRSSFPTPRRPSPQPRNDGKAGAGGAPAAAPAARDHIHINTNGPFRYDLAKNTARFAIPDNPRPALREQVLVVRNPEQSTKDQLICEHLELQFRRKAEGSRPAAADDGNPDLEIETAHATGKEVTLTSDAEVLEAHGTDLFYDARTRLTTLKGEAEMWLLKEGNEIHARELELLDQKGAQQILCRGAGRIHLLDKKSGKRTLHARWKEKFVSSRDGEYDLLTLTGNAAFVEDSSLNPQDVHNDAKLASCKSMLRAEVLQVWLEPRTRGAAPAGKPAPPQAPDKPAEGAGGRKPHHLEATGNVTVHSPEVYIHDTERLFLLFREPIAPPAGNAGPSRPETSGGPAPAAPAAGRTVVLGRSASPAEASTKAPPRPINLKARLVKAYVVRSDTRNELDEMHTEGEVRVFQEPAKREDKGVDIRGDTLRLTRKLGGNYLVVTGDLAQVRMDKLFIIGPEIHIDQSTNTAWVNGTGAMQMETKTDFQGQALAQPMPLEVHWNKRMDFDGNSVEFLGGIQAVQGESRLACELLHVYLDRPVSLKEGNRTGQPARARKLTCDGKVWVEDKVFVPRTQTLAGYRRLDCVEMTVNNDERTSHVHAPGPGMVRIVQPGGSEFGSPGPATPQRQPAGAEEWKLTLVSYFTLMRADNGRRTATFLDDVRLLHVPWDRDKPNAAIDLEKVIDNLPSGGLYLRCDRLTVYSRNSTDRKGQQLDAAGRVEVKATDAKKQIFWGTADNVHYDEEKDQVIFDGGEGGRARLSVIEVRGAPPRTVTGRKIIYLRKKGEFTGDGLTEIRGSN